MQLAQKLRDMHALAAGSCDPEYNRALLKAADEIEHLRRALRWYANATEKDFANDNGFNASAALSGEID